MATKSISRKERRALRQQRAKRQRIAMGSTILGGIVLLVAVVWMVWSNRQTGVASFDYTTEDIVYDQPIHAIHEMGAGPQIPFLPGEEPQPKIVVNERFYSFGVIGPTEVVTRDFAITNMGDAPLTISRAYTTCGCTTADLTATVIPPGKVSIMTVTLDAGFHDVRGQTVRRGVIIENNDPRNSQAEIWVQASVRTKP